ncbi:MAG: hypothetical protein SPF70_03100, partial [Lachnospiraceae bacterium]|nr:hypothetical protein [Lachnospiraceae bacterium]
GGFCLTGNVSNTSSVNSTAAGLAAYVNTPYKFSDIKARELNVSSTTNAASAFVGYNEKNLEFVNCSIVNESSNVYEIKSNSHVGGFVGNSVGGNLSFSECNITNLERNSYHFTSTSGNVGGFIGNASSTGPTLTFENCNITNLAADSKKNYTGGFVGWTESVLKVNTNGTNTTEIRGLEIHNERPNVGQHFSVGGIVGKTRNSVEAGKISLVDSVLEFVKIEGGNTNNTYIGGVVGWAEGWSAQSQTIHAWDIVIGSESAEETLALKSIQNESNGYGNAAIGGIIGGLNISARLENCQLLGYSNSDDYTTKLTDGSWIGGMVGWIEAGSGSVILVNPQVKNIFMELRRDWDQSKTNLVGAAGGFIGQTGGGSATVDISLAIVANLKIVNKHSDDFIMPQGGMIGYVKCPVTITDFGISGLNLGSDGYCAEAGGIAGRIVSSDNGGRISVGNSGDYPYNLIQDSVISAQVSGGIFAQSSSTGVSDIKNVKLSNVSVIARKINETNSTAAYAGGVAGDIVSDAPNNYENISIENSVITGYPINQNTQDIYIGGVVGGREKEAAEEHFNQITLHNVLIGLMTDNLAQIPTYENVINKSVSLFTTIGDASGQKRLSKEDTSNIVDPQYTLRMGMFAGKNLSGNNTYIINAKVEYDEDTVCYRPASDVGTVKIFTAMEDVYEDYRDKYHIIYSDYMTTDKADLEDIQDIWDNHVYQNQQDSDNNDYRMEVSYGQSNVAYEDIKNIYQSTCRDSQGWVSTLQDADGNTIPVIVVSEWSYDVNALINTYLNLITNNGGAVNSGIQSIVDVTIERKQLIDGVSSDATATQIISYKNGSFAVTKGYDEYKDEKNATYTLVTVSYLYGDNAVCTVSLPIFVKEMLTLETHIKYMEGAQYSLEDVPTSDLCSAFKASVEHQSKYTIYSEFVYSSVRENLTDVTLKKSICMKDNKNVQKQFYAGTKLTLIDVSGGGKVYYYTVEKGKTKSEIAFADFKDVDGNSYVDVNMGKDSLTEYPSVDYTDVCGHVHTSVGVEKFLIIIDETGTTETANEINRIIVKPLARDNPTMQRNVNYSPVCYVELTEIAGLLKVLSPNYENYSDSAELEEVKEKYNKITDSKNFNSKSDKKDEMEFGQENKISSDSTVSMSGSLYVVSPSVLDTANISDYWQAVRTSTKPRYLEIAISLRDSSGKRVSIPNGTKVIFDHNDSDYYYTNNDSGYIYYYQYSQNETPNITKLTENTWFNFSVELDFSRADLSKVNTETYRVYVELYEYTKDDMPQSGKTIDMVYDSVQGESKKQLGFVLHTNESITLGMNGRYGDITDRGLVSFRTQLDFSDYIDTQSDSDLSQYLGKYYTYTFVIKRKEKETDGVLYQYVTDDSLSDLINVYYGSLESLPDLEDVLLTDESRVVQYTKQYTDEEIKNGTVEESFSLYADVQQLAAAGKNEYFTNYSVTCYVTISEQNPASDSGITVDSLVNTAQVNDFFVFTVANIKTDME